MISIDNRIEIQKVTISIVKALHDANEKLAAEIFYALNEETKICVMFELQIGALQELAAHPLLRF